MAGAEGKMKYLIVILFLFILTIPADGEEIIVSEKVCTCGEHFRYYGQWVWCDCEEVQCDENGNCICAKPCEDINVPLE